MSSPSTPDTSEPESQPYAAPVNESQGSSARGKMLFVTGITAGILVGIVCIWAGSFVKYTPEIAEALGNVNANVDFGEVKRQDANIRFGNTVICGLLAGLIFVGAVGSVPNSAAGGIAKRFLVSAILGAIAGAVGGALGITVWQYLVAEGIWLEGSTDTSFHAAIANACIWGLVGMTAGAVFCDKKADGVLSGLVSGVLGAGTFMLVTMFALTAASTDLPIPGDHPDSPWIVARMLWAVIPAVIITLFLARSLLGGAKNSVAEG